MFAFKIVPLFSVPIPLGAEGALLSVSFQHFRSKDTTFGAGRGKGDYNIGLKLYRKGNSSILVDARGRFSKSRLRFGEVALADFHIRQEEVSVGVQYEAVLDVVEEFVSWFSDTRRGAIRVSIHFADIAPVVRNVLASGQATSAAVLLAKSSARILELEQAERNLIGQRDEHRSREEALERHLELAYRGLTALPPPSERASAILLGLDAVQRRDLWLSQLVNLGLSGPPFALYPHNGEPGPYQILVHGSGGYGDMIYLSAVVRELHALFSPCVIFVMHENRFLSHVFGSNPYVSGLISLDPDRLRAFLSAAHGIDVYDLILDVRYAATYTTPPLSRIPIEFSRRALYSSAEYQRFVRHSWPHLNNIFANHVVSNGMQKLDVLGKSSLLPIDRESSFDLFVSESDQYQLKPLEGVPFVTVHHGADRNMASQELALQTKNLPLEFWVAVVRAIQSCGFKVVQLGERHESIIEGADLHLLGETSLAQTAWIIKTASVHVDTEGGLVHVCRAVRNRSVVAFGPTSIEFFGYPENINLPPRKCGNCWWTRPDWSQVCPRGLQVPECMESHTVADIVGGIREVLAEQRTFQLQAASPALGALDVLADPEISARLRTLDGDGLIALGPECPIRDISEWLMYIRSPALILVDSARFRDLHAGFGHSLRLMAFSAGNISLADSSRSEAVGLNFDVRNEKGAAFCSDLTRLTRSGEALVRATNRGESLEASEWLRHLESASARIPGTRLAFSVKDIAFGDDGLATAALNLRFVSGLRV